MNHSASRRTRFLALFPALLIAVIVFNASCVGIKVRNSVPVVLSPLATADKNQLIAEINRFAEIKTIYGKVDVKFEDNSFAESGISEKYKAADGAVIVQSPANINLKIQIPFVGTDLVQMTSNGDKFRVAVLCCVDEKYKRFVYGTNTNEYAALREKARTATGNDKQNEAISVFASLRPQHFTDALIMRPLETGTNFIYTQSEIYEDEPAKTPTGKKPSNARVIRGYYLLDELKRGENDDFKIQRRFWFDRVDTARLARQQIFDAAGVLVTTIDYGAEQAFTEAGNVKMPAQVTVTRPQERYSVKLTYQTPNAVVVGKTYESEVFQLENKWQLPEVDLDKQAAQSKLLNQ